MELNAQKNNKLDNKEIEMLKRWLNEAEPYTEEEINALPLDGECDMDKYRAYVAKDTLTKYGLL